MTTASVRVFGFLGLMLSVGIIAYGANDILRVHAPAPVVPPVQQIKQPSGIWASARPIQRGQRIQRNDLVLMPVTGNVPPTAIADIDRAVGTIAINDIPAYAFITSDHVTKDPAKAGLAQTVPMGFRAISLRTTDEIAVSNFILPGDHVDVDIVLPDSVVPKPNDPQQQRSDGNPSEARTLLQDVIVLTVGDTLSAMPADGSAAQQPVGRKPDPPHSVTLALTPDQATQLLLARSLGSLFLTLRNPADLESVQTDTAILRQIRGVTPPPATPLVEGRRPIELINGSKSTVIYSTNPSAAR